MAVLSLRCQNGDELGLFEDAAIRCRINEIARADTFSHGKWPGRRPFPTIDHPWDGGEAADDNRELAALSSAATDFRVPLAQRVSWMETWLKSGMLPEGYAEKAEIYRRDMVRALTAGEIVFTPSSIPECTAVIESVYRGVFDVGYRYAPVVVATNPQFVVANGAPFRKHTIGQYQAGYLDLSAAANELNTAEIAAGGNGGWGGSATIIGSPQGEPSRLSTELVAECVRRRMLTAYVDLKAP